MASTARSVAALSKQRTFAQVHEQDIRSASRAGFARSTQIALAEYPFFESPLRRWHSNASKHRIVHRVQRTQFGEPLPR